MSDDVSLSKHAPTPSSHRPDNFPSGEEAAQQQSSRGRRLPLLIVVEGRNDAEFLRRVSGMFQAADEGLSHLAAWERAGSVVFVPFGGGEVQSWPYRLAPLGKSEFHLYDREIQPLSETRFAAVQIVNLRPGCRAVVTGKRSLENYLHPQAIFEASGIHIDFTAEDDVAEMVARQRYLDRRANPKWLELPSRCRRRQRNRAKQWLNTTAVERMTVERLAESDPVGEIRGWLAMIAEMVNSLS